MTSSSGLSFAPMRPTLSRVAFWVFHIRKYCAFAKKCTLYGQRDWPLTNNGKSDSIVCLDYLNDGSPTWWARDLHWLYWIIHTMNISLSDIRNLIPSALVSFSTHTHMRAPCDDILRAFGISEKLSHFLDHEQIFAHILHFTKSFNFTQSNFHGYF